ncbi:nitroreductase family protein [Anaerostipes caccae]|uniref:nitroreductase family protein n=1 Tax=Anaerostipes TaxID=207244 RepID=UPI002ED31A2A
MNAEKCIGCGLCAKTCPEHNIIMKNKKAGILLQDCLMCGHCSSVCPKEAVTVTGFHTKQYPQTKSVRLNPDEVLDVIRFRRTVRRFKDKKIPDAVIAQILEAGRLTHTAKNMQDVSFVVLNKKSRNWSRWLSACSEKSSLWQICSVQWPEITRYMIIFSSSRHPLSS